MTPQKWRHLIRIVITVVVLVISAVYLYLSRAQLAVLAELSLSELGLLTLCVAFYFVLTGYTFYLLVSMVSVKLSPIEWIGLTFLTNALNYLGPTRPGAVAKAVYLKQHNKLPYSRFTSVLVANGFLLFFYSGVVGLALLLSTWLASGTISYHLVLVCLALIAGSMVPFVVQLTSIKQEGRISNIINNAIDGFDEIRSQHQKLLWVIISMFAQSLLSALCYVIAYRALGFELDFVPALLIGVFTSIANFFTITPNNLGIQEAVIGYLSTVVGLEFSAGFISSSVVRAIHLLLSFGLAPLFSRLLFSPIGLRVNIQKLELNSEPSGDIDRSINK